MSAPARNPLPSTLIASRFPAEKRAPVTGQFSLKRIPLLCVWWWLDPLVRPVGRYASLTIIERGEAL